MKCGAAECDRDATEVLTFRGMSGHVHNCPADGAINREYCDVTRSEPVLPSGECPWPCSPPLYDAIPTLLEF